MTFCLSSPDNGTQHMTSPHGMLAQARRASAGNSNMAAMAGLTQGSTSDVPCVFFRKKVIQFFPKHISLMVEFEKTPSSFWGSPLGGKCQVEKVSVQSTPISKSLQVFFSTNGKLRQQHVW